MARDILVAGNDPAVRGLLARVLSDAGYGVTPARDGPEALALLSEPGRRFEAAVLDRRLRGLSGPEVVAKIRPHRPAFPVLLLSGLPDPADATDPHTRLLAKPFAVAELVRAVAELTAG